ncbi:NAD(P)/FAD-dependent oxidoreductase [Nocardioides sp. AN3]
MTTQSNLPQVEQSGAQAQGWLDAFERALGNKEADALGALFLPDAGWRDLLAFTWNLRQAHDRASVVDLLLATGGDVAARHFKISSAWPAPATSEAIDGAPAVTEVFFEFEVEAGAGDGIVYLVTNGSEGDALQARTLLTRLKSLNDAPSEWPPTGRWETKHPHSRWRDVEADRHAFADRDPEVLIVGGGQFGVMTGAHLARLGVEALIVDKLPRVGDGWRTRYEQLYLHQPHNILHFSMMPFPECMEEYIPKDKFAAWFETYVSTFDLNFWAGTEFLGGSYDETAHEWIVDVRREDGTTRTMRPKHVLMATGGADIPNVPDLPGLNDFKGEIIHSGQYQDGSAFAGKKVFIVGTGTSAHDFAHDIVHNGGNATMMQRSPIIVVDLPTANVLYGDYNDRSVPTDLVDFRFLSGMVFHQLRAAFQEYQQFANDQDKELHEGLAAAGMRVWPGEDETGFYYSYLSRHKRGYYLNVGASNAIVAGDISVMNIDDFETFDANGIVRTDGTRESYDVVILATAFKEISAGIEKYFGAALAEKIGPVWGIGTDGELRNILKPTAQEGFWILEGSIPMARWHSPLMALLIKAELLGIVPDGFKAEGHPSRTPTEPVPALAAYWSGR